MKQNNMVRKRHDTVVGHGTIRHDRILDPCFNHIMSDFSKNRHSTTHKDIKSRHDTIQHRSMTRYEIKIRHDTT
jgi:hypothetical protein